MLFRKDSETNTSWKNNRGNDFENKVNTDNAENEERSDIWELITNSAFQEWAEEY